MVGVGSTAVQAVQHYRTAQRGCEQEARVAVVSLAERLVCVSECLSQQEVGSLTWSAPLQMYVTGPVQAASVHAA